MKLETLERLRKLATEEPAIDGDDFNPYDHSGGNFDDAWYGAMRDGKKILANENPLIQPYYPPAVPYVPQPIDWPGTPPWPEPYITYFSDGLLCVSTPTIYPH